MTRKENEAKSKTFKVDIKKKVSPTKTKIITQISIQINPYLYESSYLRENFSSFINQILTTTLKVVEEERLLQPEFIEKLAF